MKKLFIFITGLSLIANVVLGKLYFFPAETEYLSEEEKQWVTEWSIMEKTPEGLKQTKTIPIQEENYRPKRKDIESVLSDPSMLMADWDYSQLVTPLKITAIELIGFESSNQNESLHLTVKDPKYIEMFENGLSRLWMRRAGYSDLAYYEFTFGCEGPDGVVLLHTAEKKIVVGLNCYGFHLGSVDTTIRTAFESWIMAKAIDDILFEKTGRRLNTYTFSLASGLNNIETQQEFHEKLINADEP